VFTTLNYIKPGDINEKVRSEGTETNIASQQGAELATVVIDILVEIFG
jgi:hypothetical protein